MAPRSTHDADYNLAIRQLAALRLRCGVTQVELARRLGVHQTQISKIERKQRRIDIAELRRFCNALGLTLRDFVDRFESDLAALPPRAPRK